MDEIKTILQTPETLDDCLSDESCFHMIKQKRDITLSLNRGEDCKCSKYIADQTPTPTTRLIRNCEEAGLFDDLKHVNPFEETFRQAIDSTSKRPSVFITTQKSLEIIKCNDEDTLHTPHIIPYNAITANNKNETNASEDGEKSETDSSLNESTMLLTQTISKAELQSSDMNNEFTSQKLNNTQKTKSQNLKPKKDVQSFRKICPKPVVVAVANPIKEKIRESLLKLQRTRSGRHTTFVNVHIPTAEQSNVRDIPKIELKRQVAVKEYKNPQDNERNREAAKRYRHKQKLRYDNLLRRNMQLEAENVLLKKQLQIFKKTYENCSVAFNYNSVFHK